MNDRIHFTKGHGTENDFVILDDPDGALELDAATVAALADRRAGIGGDGVIRAVRTRRAGIEAPADAPEWFMDYRNADGSIAEMCGNGVRVLAAHLQRAGHVREDEFAVWTRAGARTVAILQRPPSHGGTWSVRLGMGESRSTRNARTVEVAGHMLSATDVDMGNPHTVAFLPSGLALEELDLTRRPALDPEPVDGANIELVVELGQRHVVMRVFERGVGETRSCGTGVAAVAVAAALRAGDDTGQPWTVDVPGGRLQVGWTATGEVTLTGPAQLVADGATLV
ncbi:diaminopimelate epimerase [Brachybacterium alimentarium]|uniref:Diaminopimelate epimerase n=1 Tax=Brachybacterium alimentarium TaxID=47845 RepID=A0A2A3YHA6_9MICO|nr:diaminopimelate epimerase [Brachybacterium alimentarium]PCC34916.1 diaminopimelate epimerase [Brachybacterium alimentarium]PCC38700.1 diaminopimelate epimerase [Brachybacterium alimentarium]RCS80439.1 diaminopimelate epimerase [Brachybacterium alimentarium]RCS82959.1 diaminopimelate epimerase [Brachybacterium alimentarium]RCS90163.1 diaminopimelate epimerase [Brachybacterium alimentarium]